MPARERDLPQDRDALNARLDSVLLVCTDKALAERVERLLEVEGLQAVTCRNAGEAAWRIEEAIPDLVVLDAPDDEEDERLSLLSILRDDPASEAVPCLVLAKKGDKDTRLRAFALGADDVVKRNVGDAELAARIGVRLARRPVPRARLVTDPVTGALTEAAFKAQLEKEVERMNREGRPGSLAYLSLHELPDIQARLGSRARDELLAQIVKAIEADGRKLDMVGLSRGQVALLLPGTPPAGAQVRLERLSRKLYEQEFTVGGDGHRFTPALGYVTSADGTDAEELKERAWIALMYATEQLDLYPTRWRPELSRQESSEANGLRAHLKRLRTPLQVTFQQLLCFGIPLLFYFAMDGLGLDVTGGVYLVVVIALALTALTIIAESIAAIRRVEPPPLEDRAPPPASAIIAAYLPNEAETVVETVEAFLRQDYPGLQIILAYNTPNSLPIEEELREIAARDPRFEPLRVEGSASKAQNVNAALARVRGEFVGIFDADHHPAPGSFLRAWRWLASEADVVQGHCVVRNGAEKGLTRVVAAEFEAMYAVTHPGRARLHGFGIFGGSNGYWRREMIEQTRMRSFMLTEDIDSSLRVLRAGGRIVSDRGLVSTELAPDRVAALWNQRMRWAQGWSQVALRHLWAALRNRELTVRQRLGCLHLLGWRELFPWLSLQTLAILAFWLLRDDPAVKWFVPVFVATTLLTFSAGPIQAWAAWRLSHPSVGRHKSWFVLYGLTSQLFYAEFKNVINRTAHIKEAMRERKWKVTPRAAPAVKPIDAVTSVPATAAARGLRSP